MPRPGTRIDGKALAAISLMSSWDAYLESRSTQRAMNLLMWTFDERCFVAFHTQSSTSLSRAISRCSACFDAAATLKSGDLAPRTIICRVRTPIPARLSPAVTARGSHVVRD